jgi:hypothetical protein
MSDIITKTEARWLDNARVKITAIKESLREQATTLALSQDRSWDAKHQAETFGRMLGKAEDAEEAVFDLLNVLSSYGDSANAAWALEQGFARSRAATEAARETVDVAV